MKHKDKKMEEEVSMDMTPMIDVTFQLLIFFIITLKFKLLERKLNSHLPTNFGNQAIDQEFTDDVLDVSLKQRPGVWGRTQEQTTEYRLDGEVIRGKTPEDVRQTLEQRIRSFIAKHPESKGKISTGFGVPHREVVTTLDLFHRARCNTVIFGGVSQARSLKDGQRQWRIMKNRLREQ